MKKLKVSRVPGGFELGGEIITCDAHLIEIMEQRKAERVLVTSKYDQHLFALHYDPGPMLVNLAPSQQHREKKGIFHH